MLKITSIYTPGGEYLVSGVNTSEESEAMRRRPPACLPAHSSAYLPACQPAWCFWFALFFFVLALVFVFAFLLLLVFLFFVFVFFFWFFY